MGMYYTRVNCPHCKTELRTIHRSKADEKNEYFCIRCFKIVEPNLDEYKIKKLEKCREIRESMGSSNIRNLQLFLGKNSYSMK